MKISSLKKWRGQNFRTRTKDESNKHTTRTTKSKPSKRTWKKELRK